MTWLWLAFGTAVLSSLRDLFVKHKIATDNPLHIAIVQYLVATVLIGVCAAFLPIPKTDSVFLFCLFGAGITVGVGTHWFFKALQLSDVSLMIPLRSITPVLILILSLLLLNDTLTTLGSLGVITIAVGLFFINDPRIGTRFLSEFSNARGTKYMLAGSVVFAICAVFEKIGIAHSSPLFFSAWECLIGALALGTISLKRGDRLTVSSLEVLRRVYPAGVLFSAMVICQSTAYALGPLSYVVGIKSSGTVITVILGCLLMGEGNLRRRLIGCIITVLGATLISLS